MNQITDGKLQILTLVRAEDAWLPQCHRICKRRRYDTFGLVLSGKVDYHMADGSEYTLQAGDFHYLPLNCAYSIDVHSEGFRYLICDFVCPSEEPRQAFWFRPKSPQLYEKLFRTLVAQFANTEPERLAESLSVLFQIYAQVVKDNDYGYVSASARKKIQAVQNYIQQNLADRNLSVMQLASQAQMSEVHLRRLFREINGISPYQYLLDARVAKAKSLMGLSELRLEEIALQSGFSSSAHLCSAFKDVTGQTPGQYRRNL